MAVAQGISKYTTIVKQSALGTPGSTGSVKRRRTSSVFTAPNDTYQSAEIVSHQQDTGITFGIKKPNGKINCQLSAGTYFLELAALCRKDFVAGVNSTALTNVTAATTSGAQGTFTRAAGSFLTDGFKLFDVIRWTGWAGGSATNNNTKNMLIIGLTATVMTVTTLDGSAIVADAAGDSVTATVVGKKTFAPTTGHTNDYFSIEEAYTDLTKFELYTDAKPAKAEIACPATGNVTINFDWLALARTLGNAAVLTSPGAETTTPTFGAANSFIWVNGTVFPVTGMNITLDGTTVAGDAECGTNTLSDHNRGRIKVSGSFTALFKDTTIQALYNAQAPISVVLLCFDTTAVTSSFVTFVMTACKITGDAPDDGEKQVVRTYPFTAQLDAAGGAALANNQTIISIQDSNA